MGLNSDKRFVSTDLLIKYTKSLNEKNKEQAILIYTDINKNSLVIDNNNTRALRAEEAIQNNLDKEVIRATAEEASIRLNQEIALNLLSDLIENLETNLRADLNNEALIRAQLLATQLSEYLGKIEALDKSITDVNDGIIAKQINTLSGSLRSYIDNKDQILAGNLSTEVEDRKTLAADFSTFSTSISNRVTAVLSDLLQQLTATSDLINNLIISHISNANNPHNITLEQINAASKDELDRVVKIVDSANNAVLNISETVAALDATAIRSSNADSQIINGELAVEDLIVNGDLVVKGETTTVSQETLTVKDNFIILNSEGNSTTDLLTNAGIVIKDFKGKSYGIVYNSDLDAISLGAGSVNNFGDFSFTDPNACAPILTRDTADKFAKTGNILVWDSENKRAVDGAVNISKFNDIENIVYLEAARALNTEAKLHEDILTENKRATAKENALETLITANSVRISETSLDIINHKAEANPHNISIEMLGAASKDDVNRIDGEIAAIQDTLKDQADELTKLDSSISTLDNTLSNTASEISIINTQITDLNQSVVRNLSDTPQQISSDLIIHGNLNVKGLTTTVNQETLAIDDNFIILNNDGIAGIPAGIAIKTNSENTAYGILYDGVDSVNLGKGHIDNDNNFTFDSETSSPILTRLSSEVLANSDGNFFIWDKATNRAVDSLINKNKISEHSNLIENNKQNISNLEDTIDKNSSDILTINTSLILIDNAVKAETSRAKAVEGDVASLFDDLKDTSATGDLLTTSLTNAVNNELKRAKLAEKTISENLSAHTADINNPHRITLDQLNGVSQEAFLALDSKVDSEAIKTNDNSEAIDAAVSDINDIKTNIANDINPAIYKAKEDILSLTAHTIKDSSDSGQTIEGDLTLEDNLYVSGNLTVEGTTTVKNQETLNVIDNFFILNGGLAPGQSGIAIRTHLDDENYGIVYNPETKAISLGSGKIVDGKFAFDSNAANPIFVRDVSDKFFDNNIIIWNALDKKAIDGGISKQLLLLTISQANETLALITTIADDLAITQALLEEASLRNIDQDNSIADVKETLKNKADIEPKNADGTAMLLTLTKQIPGAINELVVNLNNHTNINNLNPGNPHGITAAMISAEPAFAKYDAFNRSFSNALPLMDGVDPNNPSNILGSGSPGQYEITADNNINYTDMSVARGSHVHPTDTTRAPVNHADGSTKYGKATTTLYGHVQVDDIANLSSENPVQNKVITKYVDDSIANLDVAAFELSYDETIKSISETDGKISVTTQSIKIAENQVEGLPDDLTAIRDNATRVENESISRDDALQININSVQENLNAETERAEGAEKALLEAIKEETNSRSSGDKALLLIIEDNIQPQIDVERGRIDKLSALNTLPELNAALEDLIQNYQENLDTLFAVLITKDSNTNETKIKFTEFSLDDGLLN